MVGNNRAYWEDIIVGDSRVSPARTITEADIVNFASLSGSWDPEHTDAQFAKDSPFGERIAHGLLTLAVAEGLKARIIWYNNDNLRGATFIAFLGLNNLRYLNPVKIGDTIRCEIEIAGKRETSNPQRGIATFVDRVKNQDDVVVAEWERVCLYKRRGTPPV